MASPPRLHYRSPPRLIYRSPKRRRLSPPVDEYEDNGSEDYNIASPGEEGQDLDSEGSDAAIQGEQETEEQDLDSQGSDAAIHGEEEIQEQEQEDLDSQGSHAAIQGEQESQEQDLDSQGSDAAIQGEEEIQEQEQEDLDSQGSHAAFQGEQEQEEEQDLDSQGSDAAIQGEDEEDVVRTGWGHTEVVSRSVSSSPSCSSSQYIKLKSSDILDCPTCFEPLKRPIYQCTNGHVACSSCCTKLGKRCPFCKSSIGDIRCRAMEMIIEASIVPCRNAPYGCNQTTSYGNQSSHEKLCVFVPCSCPLPNCNYSGFYLDVQAHALANHKDLTLFSFESPLNFSLDLDKKKVHVFQEKIEGDLIVVQASKGLHGVFITVSCIAPMAPEEGNLSCSLAKLNERTTLRLGLVLKNIQKVSEQEEPKDDFMFVPSYMLSDGPLKMEICIGHEDKYVHI